MDTRRVFSWEGRNKEVGSNISRRCDDFRAEISGVKLRGEKTKRERAADVTMTFISFPLEMLVT